MNRVKKQLSLLGVVATLALVFAGVAEADDDDELTLFVAVNLATDDTVIAAPLGGVSFNIEGTFAGGGTFRCWGWINPAGFGSVSQVYNIPGRGAIMTQGIEGGLLAVTGGTGDFRNVRGEALQTFTGPGFDFTIEFDLDDDDDDSDSDSD